MKVSLQKAAHFLTSAEVVALPTETVYGLAASLHQPAAIERLFALKKRPAHNPLIIHLHSASELKKYLLKKIPKLNELILAFWPGPLTIVIPVEEQKIPAKVRANLATAAFRVPDHPQTLELIKKVGPIVMPSANLSGSPSATTPFHVEKDFGSDFPVLDGGNCQNGLESTVLYFTEEKWVILRLGALTAEQIEAVLGYLPSYLVFEKEQAKPLSPGQLLCHYAPKAKLLLDKDALQRFPPFIIGFEDRIYSSNATILSLGPSNSCEIVAKNLYHALRELDIKQASWAWVDMDFPDTGLWKVIRERLQRASQ